MSYANIPFKAEIYAQELDIDWGDGSVSTYRGHRFYTVIHDFNCEGLQQIQLKGKYINGMNISRLSLTALTLVHCPHLEYLDCSVNELHQLNLGECPLIEELYCNSNNLRTLDLSHQIRLQQANLSYNILQTLNIKPCKTLQSLVCSFNQLLSLEVDATIPLHHLDIKNNLLTAETLNQVFAQLQKTNGQTVLYYSQNPGTDCCDTTILKNRK